MENLKRLSLAMEMSRYRKIGSQMLAAAWLTLNQFVRVRAPGDPFVQGCEAEVGQQGYSSVGNRGSLTQLVEYGAFNLEALGSNPRRPILDSLKKKAGVFQ